VYLDALNDNLKEFLCTESIESVYCWFSHFFRFALDFSSLD